MVKENIAQSQQQKNQEKVRKICPKLTIKTQRDVKRFSSVFIVNFPGKLKVNSCPQLFETHSIHSE